MDRQAQIDFILDHYENPRHYGTLAQADAVARGVNPGCGDVVTVYLQADDDGHITAISFEGEGCTISQAAASMVMERFAGRSLADLESATPEVILELIGSEIGATRLKCAMLGLNTLKKAGQSLRREKQE